MNSRRKALTKYIVSNSIQSLFNKKSKLPKTILLMIICVIAISLPFIGMVGALYNPFKMVGQEGMLLSLIYLAGSTVALLFGIITIMQIFYFSNDIETFLPLPFKSSDIVFAKFLAVIIDMCLYIAILILPLITFGIMSDAGVLYYVYMIISLVLVIVFPLIIASLLCTLIMRVVPLTKHKDSFKMIVGCMGLILVVVFNIFTQKMPGGGDENQIAEMFASGNNTGIEYVNGFFIINKLCSKALINASSVDGLINILIAAVISIVLFAIYYVVAGKLYLKSVIGLSETYSKRKYSLKENKKSVNTNSPLKALILKDIKIIIRTPQFFINCIAMLFYMPAIMVVCFFSNGTMEHFKNLITSGNPKFVAIAVSIIFLASGFFVSSSSTATTALSREGKDFMVSKYIPIDFKTQVNSKIITSVLLNNITTIIIAAILIVSKINVLFIILSIIISVATITTISVAGMYFDFKSPKLEWESEKQMMKGNWKPVIIMFIIFAIGFGFVGISYFIGNAVIVSILILLVNIIVSFMFLKTIYKLADKIYNN